RYFVQFRWVFNLGPFVVVCVFAFIVKRFRVSCAASTSGVEWPTDPARRPLLQHPLGVVVHHAPLAWVHGEQAVPDLRLAFRPLAADIPAAGDAASNAAGAADTAGADAPGHCRPRAPAAPARRGPGRRPPRRPRRRWTRPGGGLMATPDR
ncbi:hypothetical protein O1L55_03245, partial [Streptomyces albulus]|nr:hypothetical protein [Streptomyces noursei]